MTKHQPPRVKPCPACAAPCGVAAIACRVCGQAMPRKAATGLRARPDDLDRLSARMTALAAQEGHYKGPVPEVGKRRAMRSTAPVVARIRQLAADGFTTTEIAAAVKRSPSGVRRYAHDYGIEITAKGLTGPSMKGAAALQNWLAVAMCRDLLKRTTAVSEIAEAMGVNPATARNYMKRCRDLYGIDLPEFDRRKASGFAAPKR